MKLRAWVLVCALLGVSYTASADPWHFHAGHGHHHGHKGKGKYEYWDGNCKVKREFKKDGRYKEKRECRPQARYSPPRHRHHSDRQYSGINIPAIIIEPVIRIGR